MTENAGKQKPEYVYLKMPFFRNFTYHIDKRNWKYYFLMLAIVLAY